MQTSPVSSSAIRNFSGPTAATKDSEGKTLAKVREDVLRMTLPTGGVLVIGRLYPNPTLSPTWTWTVRLQAASLAQRDERPEGKLFRAVEVVAPPVPVDVFRVRMPW
jgi:hypothetical protein